MSKTHDHLKALGVSAKNNATSYNYDHPDTRVLESFELRRKAESMCVVIDCPEFTSLCPLTGQPDFASLEIRIYPDTLMVETKSLKLYLMGFRGHGGFHEECISRICNDLVELLNPKGLVVTGNFLPRGGIALRPVAEFHRE